MADRRLTQLMRMDNRGPQNVIRTVNIYAEEGPQQIEILAPATWMGAFPAGEDKIQLHYSGNDSQVNAALLDIVGPKGTKRKQGPTYGVKTHLWAALGVAVTVADRSPRGLDCKT